jgi:hypothetical protein
VWCRDCKHPIEPDPAEMAERYGATLLVPDCGKRLVCSACGSRKIDFVVTGSEPRRARASAGLSRRGSPHERPRPSIPHTFLEAAGVAATALAVLAILMPETAPQRPAVPSIHPSGQRARA